MAGLLRRRLARGVANGYCEHEVALKFPIGDQIELDLIRQEARLWAQVSGHPNVLPIIEANVYSGQVVIVSEYAPMAPWNSTCGVTRSSTPFSSAVQLMSGILAGLEHLHARQIIHRDLKPANVLLQGSSPRLTDLA